MHLLGKTYSKRPSEIIGVKGDWAAYQFDRACLIAGTSAENEAYDEKRPSGSVPVPKRDEDFAGVGALQQAAGGSFKKVKINDDGTW